MNQFAEVVLPVAVDKSFTYLLPPELQSSATPGTRVVVPFGRKYITGIIVGLSSATDVKGLKPIKDVLDSHPSLDAEMLALCKWIADYYFAPPGEVIKAALPHGFSSSKRRASTGLTKEELEHHNTPRTKKRYALLKLLVDRGPTMAADLQKSAGVKNIHSFLNELEREGLLSTEEVLPHPRQSIKTKPFVNLLSLDVTTLASTLDSLPPRRKKARALLQSLLEQTRQEREEIAVADLLKASGTTSAALKEFVTSGLVEIIAREINRAQDFGTEHQTLHITLNEDQRSILNVIADAIDHATTQPYLLHGVTGSGKTQVYIEAIRHCLDRRKTAIVLVPEISLTPQIVRRFKSHFGDHVAVVHSRMSTGERYDVWRLASQGKYRIVIGPRSAIFAPLANLGLIVVDEEHESSYKQYDSMPRYNARDVAIVRGLQAKAAVVLGSATPSAESYHNAQQGKYALLRMPHRIDQVPMPQVRIVDMTDERKRHYAALKEALLPEQRSKLKEFKQSPVSDLLRGEIAIRLEKKEGVILLQNRRGFAPFVECQECGYVEQCDNCSITLTYHLAQKHLRCHYCGLVRQPHNQCPQCGGNSLELRGIGTQRVEQELAQLFPEARILRMDLDTTSRKGAHDRILKKFGDSEADILLGTQMVAKGLDFARVTLVGVISADTQMLLPDFRSSERTFQLLTQVAGRAGRSLLSGEVIIQTHQAQHHTLTHVVDHDVVKFYEEELEERRALDYPPFSRLALIEMRGEKEATVQKESTRFAGLLRKAGSHLSILGPTPAVIAKINNAYRWHIILKSPKTTDPSGHRLRESIRATLREFEKNTARDVRTIIDIDPIGLM
jgi:primosomal protein N' (replication factor Y) (superfamily II helicase)